MGNLTTNNARELEKELNKALDELKRKNEDRYTVDVSGLYPETPVYDRLTYNKLSDEELKKKVLQELEGETKQGKQKLYDDLDKTVRELGKRTEGLTEFETEQLKIIENAYKTLVTDIGNTSLKKGVARSSIVSEQVKETGENKAEKEAMVKGETEAKLTDVKRQIDEANAGIETALGDFDINMAKKLTAKVETLQKEQTKLEGEATKYNNSVSQKETKEKQERVDNMTAAEEKKRNEMREMRSKEELYEKEYNDYLGEKKENYTERYDIAKSFYAECNDPRTALALIKSNPQLENYLGIYYRKLLRSFGG